MTDTPQHDRRPRRAAPHRWAAWASRLVLSFLFAVGMVGAGARPLVEVEREPTLEIGEDGEVASSEETEARIVRRTSAQRRAPLGHVVARPRPPQRLEPTAPAPTPPRWQRPRRAPPPAADDDTSMG